MTKFISIEEKEKGETVFTHCLITSRGWTSTRAHPSDYEKVVYLGKCDIDGDMFAAYHGSRSISIFKGTKGIEFNN